ncbi:helix-turn-helix transcriptional regulator [Pseudomonas chlororaphis]|uniref:helix-turn-helix transcriptional regulator n=1 Tax=Pseudomonas chlororaphis TaxID=587753 RepID=UPI0007B3B594|nr:helix-turn-helix transcriptional regulator [Pseudomonas chlororaphis]AZC64065.1 Transcriptional regulator, LuxR family [Pseudomonas chlororaphis subsp. piscium]AZC70289.1 Transcriptional regulator, LuxR family [Pseudomonas chlororaphis subsp. piscium]KZO48821.1 LuxR family transcriptional regulator [Pseudomonas chlororaphis subsp. piscium]MBP5069389.1 helix-turn-helix transcriptional regulator [Pseudomonas chlororaphis]
MSLTSSIRNIDRAHFYNELGELISSTGNGSFATRMLHLVDKLVPVQRVELAQWSLDERQASILEIKPLGSAGLEEALPPTQPWQYQDDHPLLEKMIEMNDSLLIQMNAQTSSKHPRYLSHQCHLVSRKANRRCVITFLRPPAQRLFSLAELSFLKSLSQTLLPLVERHAQINRQACQKNLGLAPGSPLAAVEQSPLQREFNERLCLGDITLSAREKEVCLGLLTGGTVPEMAERLSVKNSSVETYLKRAAAKLGVSGRHGLAKWMVGA